MYKKLLLVLFVVVTACSTFNKPAVNIKLPAMFSSNMVLQKGMDIPFWGTADPGGKVTITIGSTSLSTAVKPDSSWRIDFPAFNEYGGPLTVQVIGADTTTYDNVMIGEVWVCSGQSNMEMPLAGWGKINNYEQEIADANHPDIRLLTVSRALELTPVHDIKSDGWVPCSPENIPEFSATAYFFGRYLNQQLDIPIGLIHTSWGGTPAEAWTSKASLEKLKDYAYLASETDNGNPPSLAGMMEIYQTQLTQWNATIDSIVAHATGNDLSWSSPDLDRKNWNSMKLPMVWEKADLENFNGIVWYYKEFELSQADAGQNAVLSLGPIDDMDITCVNGKQVGSTASYNAKRVYQVPADLVKPGKNQIAVQVLDTGGNGGFWGTPDEMKLTTGSGKIIPLNNSWKYKAGPELTRIPFQPVPPNTSNSPTVLYNGMIYPLIPYAIRGAIWYQGENNAQRAHQYQELFKTMITDWRNAWAEGDFPFILTQLANYQAYKSKPGDDDWAELREAQTMALELPNTAMAVTIDIGNANDIHPKDKQDVGKRLALNALNMVYGKTDVVPCGPLYKSSEFADGKAIISFDYVDGGLVANDGDLIGFAIAGADSNWVWAQAKIDGEKVVVWNDAVTDPIAVRYAWQSNPKCNLYNAAELPASPFRTDDWPGITY